MKTTLGKRLTDLKGKGPGFDHLRIGLALSILTWHSFSISYGQRYGSSLPRFPVPVYLASLLPMFFGLSGFLVMGSALRVGELKKFMTFRVLRILPALFTEIMISALILGPMLTAYPLAKYFKNPMFFEYFGSLVGRVRFSLPGLFLTNPAPELVNFALWTVGPEILCYVIMAMLLLTNLYRSRKAMTTITLIYLAFTLVIGWVFPTNNIIEVLPSKILIYAFLCGNLIYLYRDDIIFDAGAAIISLILGYGLIYLAQVTGFIVLTYIAVPGMIYSVAFIGLSDLPPLPFFQKGDYSYGIYIYGFPIQQAIAYFLPNHREWYVNLAFALPLTLIFAVTSWHLIEKPVLNLRNRVKASIPEKSAIAGDQLARKVGIFIALGLYGVFVIDASNVLPVRPGIKMALYGFGLYTYKANDRRAWVSDPSSNENPTQPALK